MRSWRKAEPRAGRVAERRARRAQRVMPLLLATLLAAAVTGCVVEEEPLDEGPTASLAERSCPPNSELSWEGFGAPFMLSWCNGCHGAALPFGQRQDAPLGSNFDTVDDVRHWADRIWARAADHNVSMPPVGGPDGDEREMLGEWLACGAPTRADLDAAP